MDDKDKSWKAKASIHGCAIWSKFRSTKPWIDRGEGTGGGKYGDLSFLEGGIDLPAHVSIVSEACKGQYHTWKGGTTDHWPIQFLKVGIAIEPVIDGWDSWAPHQNHYPRVVQLVTKCGDSFAMVGHNMKTIRLDPSARRSRSRPRIRTRQTEENKFRHQRRTSRKLRRHLAVQYYTEDRSWCMHKTEESQRELRRRGGNICLLQENIFSSDKFENISRRRMCIPVSLWTCFRLFSEWWRDPDAGLIVVLKYIWFQNEAPGMQMLTDSQR